MSNKIKVLSGAVLVAIAGLTYWLSPNAQKENIITENTETSTLPETDNSAQTNNSSQTTPTPTPTPTTPAPTTPAPTKTATKYKDGTYSVEGQYTAPPGPETMGIKVTITNDKITNLVFENKGKHQGSSNYQNRFISGINSVAINQPIETLKVGVVSGASLTSNAFNQALAKVRSQALQ